MPVRIEHVTKTKSIRLIAEIATAHLGIVSFFLMFLWNFYADAEFARIEQAVGIEGNGSVAARSLPFTTFSMMISSLYLPLGPFYRSDLGLPQSVCLLFAPLWFRTLNSIAFACVVYLLAATAVSSNLVSANGYIHRILLRGSLLSAMQNKRLANVWHQLSRRRASPRVSAIMIWAIHSMLSLAVCYLLLAISLGSTVGTITKITMPLLVRIAIFPLGWTVLPSDFLAGNYSGNQLFAILLNSLCFTVLFYIIASFRKRGD